MDVITLKKVLIQAKEYGESYFSNEPMGRFTTWLEAQVLMAEVDAAEQAHEADACMRCGKPGFPIYLCESCYEDLIG